MRRIYLDNAATTAVHPQVFEKMTPYFLTQFGNPSSIHTFGNESAGGVDEAREEVAKAIGAKTSEIYFTASGTEADNWALRGMAKRKGKGHIITSSIEHPAIIETCEDLKKSGFEITFLPVDKFGIVDLEVLEQSIKEDTILISVMSANNEVGSLQPIDKIAKIAKAHKIPFHTDAVQAMGALKFNVVEMGIDMLSLSAHKFNGPKGIGVLYIRNGLGLGKFVTGGEQERGMRAGTVATPLVVGLGEAIKLAYKDLDKKNQYLISLRDYAIDQIFEKIPHCYLNGHKEKRLPNNINMSFEFVEGESILMLLDMNGVAVSTGSACSSGSLKSSHVLHAMGVEEGLAHGSIRMTLNDSITRDDIDYAVEQLKNAVEKMRAMSPLFAEFKGGQAHV